jgi:hypothetical protein
VQLNIKIDPEAAMKLFQVNIILKGYNNDCLVFQFSGKLLSYCFKISNVNKRKIKGEQAIDAEEFIQFYQLLLVRPEIETLFRK